MHSSGWKVLPLAALGTVVLACEPPPEVGPGDLTPKITIAHPQLNGDDVPLTCVPNADFVCGEANTGIDPYVAVLEMLVVVDIDNLILTDPYQDGVVDVDGQGHWHAAFATGEGYTPSFGQSTTVQLDADPGDFERLTVSLQTNTHEDLGYDDAIEFNVVAATEDCSAKVEDYCPAL